MLKILLRNHGLLRTVKLLDVTLEEQKGCIKNLEEIFLKKTCMKKKGYMYKKKLKCVNLRHRVEMKKQLCNLRSKNPKKYWNILNSDVDKQRCSADLHDLFTFYKNVVTAVVYIMMNQKTVYFPWKNLIC